MSSEPTPILASALRQWAARQLNLPDGVTPEAARTVFMRRLREEGFLPSERLHRSAAVLLDRPANAGLLGSVDLEIEERIGQAVESLAEKFFRLDPAERARRWQEIKAQSLAFPTLQARLDDLAAGLRIVPGVSDDGGPLVATLATHLAELFVLRPADRAVRRRELTQAYRTEYADWLAAASRLGAENPELARLDPAQLIPSLLAMGDEPPAPDLTHAFHPLDSAAVSDSHSPPSAIAGGESGCVGRGEGSREPDDDEERPIRKPVAIMLFLGFLGLVVVVLTMQSNKGPEKRSRQHYPGDADHPAYEWPRPKVVESPRPRPTFGLPTAPSPSRAP